MMDEELEQQYVYEDDLLRQIDKLKDENENKSQLGLALYTALAEELEKQGLTDDIPSVIDQLVGKNCGKYADIYNKYKSQQKELEELKKDIKSQKCLTDLYLTIASTNATKMSIAKAVCKQICDEIRTYDRTTNKQKVSYTEYVIGLCKILDQIERGELKDEDN